MIKAISFVVIISYWNMRLF